MEEESAAGFIVVISIKRFVTMQIHTFYQQFTLDVDFQIYHTETRSRKSWVTNYNMSDSDFIYQLDFIILGFYVYQSNLNKINNWF